MVFVDGHVHIYGCFDLAALFDAAYRNFLDAARRHGADTRFNGILMLTETSNDQWFRRLVRHASADSREPDLNTMPWRLHILPEKCSLLAKRETGEALFLIAGSQIITSEGLEVLALATDCQFADGGILEETLRNIRAQDAIPVIPWAAGKWLGRRGKVLSDALTIGSGKELFLGDNGGRPVFWQQPAHFRLARASGLRILPGSDPLPFATEVSRIGSFGFFINASASSSYPAADVKKLLRNNASVVNAYGDLAKPMRFLFNQIRLRMARRAT